MRCYISSVDGWGVPDRIVIDKSGANLAALQSPNVTLKFTGSGRTIGIVQSKHLNNIIVSSSGSLGQRSDSKHSILRPQR